MKKVIVTMSFLSMSLYGLSNAEATKFVDQYDNMSKRILGLINCVSRALTGDDAVSSVNDKSIGTSGKGSADMRSCVEAAGFKTGSGFGKLLTMFSKEGGGSDAQAFDRAELAVQQELHTKLPPTIPAPNLIQRKVAQEQPRLPTAEKKTPVQVAPKINTAVKTKW